MSIQYISDIHLEFHDKQNKGAIHPEMFVTPVAPYLVLAGDIGIPDLKSYSVFLKWCSQKWKRVFLVAGNHEYYNIRVAVKSDIPTRKKLIQTICEGLPNVHFLDCTSVYVPELKLRILGCTLWSDIPDCIKDKAILYMNDTKQILHQLTSVLHVSAFHQQYPKLIEYHTNTLLTKYAYHSCRSCRATKQNVAST